MKINKKFIYGSVLVAIMLLIGFIIKDCAKTNLGAVVVEAFLLYLFYSLGRHTMKRPMTMRSTIDSLILVLLMVAIFMLLFDIHSESVKQTKSIKRI